MRLELLRDADARQREVERTRIRGIVRDKLGRYAHRQAGVVLTFGTAPFDDPEQGNSLSATVNALLVEEFPHVFEEAVLNSYHKLSRDPDAVGTVELEIYWLLE